jgi:hypothetical protein
MYERSKLDEKRQEQGMTNDSADCSRLWHHLMYWCPTATVCVGHPQVHP